MPDELAIRELVALDVTNLEAVTAFVGTYGVISRTAKESGLHVFLEHDDDASVPVRAVDVALHLAEVQALARHFLARRKGLDVCEAWSTYAPQSDAHLAEALFVSALNNGLRWYHVRIEAELSFHGNTQPFDAPWVGLYSALCLQIYNFMMADDELPNQCPECGFDFFRQRGRSAHGQSRSTGVTYCSKQCANRAAQRASRKRKKQSSEVTE